MKTPEGPERFPDEARVPEADTNAPTAGSESDATRPAAGEDDEPGPAARRPAAGADKPPTARAKSAAKKATRRPARNVKADKPAATDRTATDQPPTTDADDNGDKPAARANKPSTAKPASAAKKTTRRPPRNVKANKPAATDRTATDQPPATDADNNVDNPAARTNKPSTAKPAGAAKKTTRRPTRNGNADKPTATKTSTDQPPAATTAQPAAAADDSNQPAPPNATPSANAHADDNGDTPAARPDEPPTAKPASAAKKTTRRPARDGEGGEATPADRGADDRTADDGGEPADGTGGALRRPAARSAGGGDKPAAGDESSAAKPASVDGSAKGDESRPAGKAIGREQTTVLRLPEQAGDGVDQATTFLRVPVDTDEVKDEGKDEGKEERKEKAADQATTHLRAPREPDKAPKPAATAAPPRPDSPPTPAAKATAEATAEAAAPPMPTVPPQPADSERDPLELLAALTNRPPPPPTPLRTAFRRIRIYTPLVVLLLIVLVVAQSLRPLPEPGLTLSAAETFTFDGESPAVPWPASGQAALVVEGVGDFGTSGEQQPVPIASVAKAMTAYVILQEHPMEPGSPGAAIPVDEQAEEDAGLSEDGESTVEVTAGSEISQREALQAIMIASANNVARLLARWDAGSEAEFVDKMNATAAELGMENTTYTDPSGLNSDTVSTAEDQVLLGRAAMEDPVFREIVGQLSYDDSQGENHSNWNQLVSPGDVVGIKTGTTTAAGGNLLFAAVQEIAGQRQMIIGAVLAQPPDPVDNSILIGALNAGRELIDFGQERLRGDTVFTAGQEIGYVDDGLGGHTPLVVTEDVQAAGWDGLEVRVELTAGGDGVPGTADAGTEVGTVTVGGASVPVALGEELTEPAFTDRLLRLG